jgi:hypothetical protein
MNPLKSNKNTFKQHLGFIFNYSFENAIFNKIINFVNNSLQASLHRLMCKKNLRNFHFLKGVLQEIIEGLK